MAFPDDAILIDDFERADGPIGDNWPGVMYPQSGNGVLPVIESGYITYPDCSSLTDQPSAYFIDAATDADIQIYAETDPTDIATGGWPDDRANEFFLFARMQNVGTIMGQGYAVQASPAGSAVRVWRFDWQSGNVLLAQYGSVVESGGKLGFEIVGNTITTYLWDSVGGWTNLGSVNDTTYPNAGYIGIWVRAYGTGASRRCSRIDAIYASNVVEPTAHIYVGSVAMEA